MAQLTLNFAYHAGQIQLEKTVFRLSPEIEYITVRGKTPGAYRGAGCFQWTPAVKAMCVLFIQALARSFEDVYIPEPTLSGRRGSLAASLDYAIDKGPLWLCDMFGLDMSGRTNLRWLILRTNSGNKRPGPVCLSLNESILSPENIKVVVNAMPIHRKIFLEGIIDILTNEALEVIGPPPLESGDSSISLTKQIIEAKKRILTNELFGFIEPPPLESGESLVSLTEQLTEDKPKKGLKSVISAMNPDPAPMLIKTTTLEMV